jgi:hypothetical protein
MICYDIEWGYSTMGDITGTTISKRRYWLDRLRDVKR